MNIVHKKIHKSQRKTKKGLESLKLFENEVLLLHRCFLAGDIQAILCLSFRRIRDNFPVAIKKIAKAKIASLYHGVPLEVLLLQKVTKYPVPAYRVPCISTPVPRSVPQQVLLL
jgi:hypothetical protein